MAAISLKGMFHPTNLSPHSENNVAQTPVRNLVLKKRSEFEQRTSQMKSLAQEIAQFEKSMDTKDFSVDRYAAKMVEYEKLIEKNYDEMDALRDALPKGVLANDHVNRDPDLLEAAALYQAMSKLADGDVIDGVADGNHTLGSLEIRNIDFGSTYNPYFMESFTSAVYGNRADKNALQALDQLRLDPRYTSLNATQQQDAMSAMARVLDRIEVAVNPEQIKSYIHLVTSDAYLNLKNFVLLSHAISERLHDDPNSAGAIEKILVSNEFQNINLDAEVIPWSDVDQQRNMILWAEGGLRLPFKKDLPFDQQVVQTKQVYDLALKDANFAKAVAEIQNHYLINNLKDSDAYATAIDNLRRIGLYRRHYTEGDATARENITSNSRFLFTSKEFVANAGDKQWVEDAVNALVKKGDSEFALAGPVNGSEKAIKEANDKRDGRRAWGGF